MQPGDWGAAYVLHRRPYRNTSYIIDLWTEHAGRISVVAKSARGNRSRFRGQLEPFTRLSVTFCGSGDLKNLTQAEVAAMPYDLRGDAIWCAYYMNELILRLFAHESPYPTIFTAYEETLRGLCSPDLQTPLRHFECLLLRELGYGILLTQDEAGQPIEAKKHYRFFPGSGFSICDEYQNSFIFSGETLQVLQSQCSVPKHLQSEAKRLMRIALQPLLGDKPLKSREFFVTTT